MLNPGSEAPAGLLHRLPVYGDALFLDGGNERCLGGMRASVSFDSPKRPKRNNLLGLNPGYWEAI